MSAVFLGLLSAVLFGAATPASKELLQSGLTPLQLAGFLYLGAALGVSPMALRSSELSLPRLRERNWGYLGGAVLFGGIFGPILMLLGLELSTAGSISLMLNLEMAATAMLGALRFREPLSRLAGVGVAGIVGAGSLVSASGGWPGLAGGLLAGAACVCWAFDNQWTALIDALTPSQTTFLKGIVAGAVNLTLGVALAPMQASWPVVAGGFALGAVSYGASIALHIAAAQRLGATRAQGLFAASPFVGAALSFFLLGEVLNGYQIVAAGLLAVSVGAVLAGRHEHEHRHDAFEHVHSHRHDDGHHFHVHPELPSATRHTHRHRHERVVHRHPHWPDLHHHHEH